MLELLLTGSRFKIEYPIGDFNGPIIPGAAAEFTMRDVLVVPRSNEYLGAIQMDLDLDGSKFRWIQIYMDPNLHGSKIIWIQIYMDPNLDGSKAAFDTWSF